MNVIVVILCFRILHLAVTIFIQYFLMRDLEKLTGAVRIGFIYIGSGVAGNLASAIFVPYRADVSLLSQILITSIIVSNAINFSLPQVVNLSFTFRSSHRFMTGVKDNT